jgi:hypothetical protein
VVATANWFLPLVDWTELRLQLPYVLPWINPVGDDFRSGIYAPAQGLLAGLDPYRQLGLDYPPATLLLGLLYGLLAVDEAYFLHVAVILFACVTTAWLVTRMAVASADGLAALSSLTAWTVGHALFLTAAFITVLSYGFVFAVERGNFDALAILAGISGLWLLVQGKGGYIGPVILLSLAAHLKVYPAILLALVPWKLGWRSLPLLVGVNLGLLFVTGWGNGIAFWTDGDLCGRAFCLDWESLGDVLRYPGRRLRGALWSETDPALGLLCASPSDLGTWRAHPGAPRRHATQPSFLDRLVESSHVRDPKHQPRLQTCDPERPPCACSSAVTGSRGETGYGTGLAGHGAASRPSSLDWPQLCDVAGGAREQVPGHSPLPGPRDSLCDRRWEIYGAATEDSGPSRQHVSRRRTRRSDPLLHPVIGGLRKRAELCLDRLPGGQRVLELASVR